MCRPRCDPRRNKLLNRLVLLGMPRLLSSHRGLLPHSRLAGLGGVGGNYRLCRSCSECLCPGNILGLSELSSVLVAALQAVRSVK